MQNRSTLHLIRNQVKDMDRLENSERKGGGGESYTSRLYELAEVVRDILNSEMN